MVKVLIFVLDKLVFYFYWGIGRIVVVQGIGVERQKSFSILYVNNLLMNILELFCIKYFYSQV